MGDELFRKSVEASNAAIDRFQIMVDLQDQKLDLKCKVGDHDYGEVLIAELERVQQGIFLDYTRGYEKTTEAQYQEASERLDEITGTIESVIGAEAFRAMSEQGNEMAREFLPQELRQLEQKLSRKNSRIFRDLANSYFKNRKRRQEYLEELKGATLDEEAKDVLSQPYRDLEWEDQVGFTEEELEHYGSYLVSVIGALEQNFLSEEDSVKIMKRWKDLIIEDPQFVVKLFRGITARSYENLDEVRWHDLHRDYILLSKDYRSNPRFLLGILTTPMPRLTMEGFNKFVLKPHKERIAAYPEEFLDILDIISNDYNYDIASFMSLILESPFYDDYFLKDPQGLLEMVRIAGSSTNARRLFVGALPKVEEEFQANGFNQGVEKHWRAYSAVFRNYHSQSGAGYARIDEELEILAEEIWPDIQAQPELIEQLGSFTVHGQGLSPAYRLARETILAQPEEFIQLMNDSIHNKYGDIPVGQIYQFQQKVVMAWPYLDATFRQEGYSEDMKEVWSHVMEMPSINSESFGIISEGVMDHPEGALDMLNDLNEEGYLRRRRLDILTHGDVWFASIAFPAMQAEFKQNGYSEKVKSYLEDAKDLYILAESDDVRYVVLRDLMPEVYKEGKQPKHESVIAFFANHVVSKLEYEDREEYIAKINAYLADPEISGLLRDEIFATTGNLADVVDHLERGWTEDTEFIDRYSIFLDPHMTIQRALTSDSFPLDPLKIKALAYSVNRITVERTRRVEGVVSDQDLFTLSPHQFDKVYYAASFQQGLKDYVLANPGGVTFMNSFSLAHAVYRHIKQNGEAVNESTIGIATKSVIDRRELVKNREIFGPDTKLILFTHEEPGFDNAQIIERTYKRAGGTEENILCDVKGLDMQADGTNANKKLVLESIENAKSGNVTLLFSGHGSKENWGFSANLPGNLNHNIWGNPTTINYREMGDALHASGNIENFNMLGLTCLGYDYLQNVFDYLENVKGVRTKPFVAFSAANENRYAYSQSYLDVGNSKILSALYEEKEEGEQIQLQDFWNVEAENNIWKFQDAAIFHEGVEIGAREILPGDPRAV
jgi:hypothetical protein